MDFLRGTHDERINLRPIVLGACFGWGLVLGVLLMNMRGARLVEDAGAPAAYEPPVAVAVDPAVGEPPRPGEASANVASAPVIIIPDHPLQVAAMNFDFDPAAFPEPLEPILSTQRGLTATTALPPAPEAMGGANLSHTAPAANRTGTGAYTPPPAHPAATAATAMPPIPPIQPVPPVTAVAPVATVPPVVMPPSAPAVGVATPRPTGQPPSSPVAATAPPSPVAPASPVVPEVPLTAGTVSPASAASSTSATSAGGDPSAGAGTPQPPSSMPSRGQARRLFHGAKP